MRYIKPVKSCENDEDHGPDFYCDHCSTCQCCVSEHDEFNEDKISALSSQIRINIKEIATLKAERDANQLVMTSDTIHIIDLETRLINSNKACDDWREQAQRNDTPVKSAAEIGRDAILSAARKLYFKNRGSSHASDDYHDLERYANDLTNNTGA